MKPPLTIDFETKPITDKPWEFPPEPVGVSIKVGKRRSVYTRGTPQELGVLLLKAGWCDRKLIFHNGIGFDVAVAVKHCGLPMPAPEQLEDTLPMLFMLTPYARTLSLKPSAALHLGFPNDDQADLRAWIMANVPEAKAKPKQWGAYIWLAPLELTKKYAEGDTDKTLGLHEWGMPQLRAMGMEEAYRREMRVAPALIRNGIEGVRLDREKVEGDAEAFAKRLEATDDEIRKALRAPDLEVDTQALGDVLARRGYDLPHNQDGSYSTAKTALAAAGLPPKLLGRLLYRSALAQALRTFTIPMARQSRATGGRMHTHWNQVRGTAKDGAGGARTGRQSSEPNLQNLPSPEKLEALYARLAAAFTRGKLDAARALFPLPQIRSYIVPDHKGWVIFGRDWSQQELRILAHYEAGDGFLRTLYNEHPEVDLHTVVQEMIFEITGIKLSRKIVKVLNFCTIYGGGAQAVSDQGDIPLAEAQEMQRLYFSSLPTIRETMNEAQRGGWVRTIGGRVYFPEEPKLIKGRWRTFDYKLLNYLIQGSAADQAKEAIARWNEEVARHMDARFLMSVHDELVFTGPKKELPQAMAEVRRIMNDGARLGFEVPFLSEGYVGPNWADVEDYVDPEVTP